MPEHMPDAMSRTLVKTRLTLSLFMALYAPSLFAENAKKVVEDIFDENRDHMFDVISFHGEVTEF